MKVNVIEKYEFYKKLQKCYWETFKEPCPSVSKFNIGKMHGCVTAQIAKEINGELHNLFFISDWTFPDSFHMITIPMDLTLPRSERIEKVGTNISNWLNSLLEEYNERGNTNG